MVLSIQVIELIAKLAIEVGEHVIPAIINICHPNADDGHQKQYQAEVKKLMSAQNPPA